MPYKLKAAVRHKFKKKSYNKRDWKGYEAGLRHRGSLTIWFSEDALSLWEPSESFPKKRGRRPKYSDYAVEVCQSLGLVYHLHLRQTEGFVGSLINLLNLDLAVPDHTTLSRRGATVKFCKDLACAEKKSSSSHRIVVIDSTGLKVFGEKEWMAYKHGVRQRKVWRKLHIAIDEEGNILSSTLTSHTVSDPSQVDPLLKQIDGPINEFLGDGAYDEEGCYEAINSHQARHNQTHCPKVIIPPNTGFRASQETDSHHRRENIRIIEDKGKQTWQTHLSYGRRSHVENVMYRYKSTFGNKLKARNFQNQLIETRLACLLLNKMQKLGKSNAQIST